MGRQIGEEFRDWFPKLLEHFARWLLDDPDGNRPAIAQLRKVVLAHCPEVYEETLGMADGAGIESERMLGLRYFNEIAAYRTEGCCGVFLTEGREGPLLGRTCDIEPDLSAQIQLCRVCRPAEGARTLLITYLGLTGGVGINEHGLGLAGSSASGLDAHAGSGLPTAVLNHLIMTRCRSLADVRDLLARHTMRCKGAVELICDQQGGSTLVELASGRVPVLVPRPLGRRWQVCSNFFVSGRIPIRPQPAYLESAYARYGRMVHQLDQGLTEPTVAGLKTLLRDVAQPGFVVPEAHCVLRTAYAFVAEPASGRMHLCAGHPAEAEFQIVSL
jgi:hypothetical protein